MWVTNNFMCWNEVIWVLFFFYNCYWGEQVNVCKWCPSLSLGRSQVRTDLRCFNELDLCPTQIHKNQLSTGLLSMWHYNLYVVCFPTYQKTKVKTDKNTRTHQELSALPWGGWMEIWLQLIVCGTSERNPNNNQVQTKCSWIHYQLCCEYIPMTKTEMVNQLRQRLRTTNTFNQ